MKISAPRDIVEWGKSRCDLSPSESDASGCDLLISVEIVQATTDTGRDAVRWMRRRQPHLERAKGLSYRRLAREADMPVLILPILARLAARAISKYQDDPCRRSYNI